MKVIWIFVRGLMLTGLMPLLAACTWRDEVLRQRFETAWSACMAGECAAQERVAREWLCRHPDSVAGHYLLGKSFLHRPEANTTIAKGEFETALMLLEEGAKPDLPAGAIPEEDIRALLHRDIALALMRALYDGAALVPPAVAIPVANRALWHVREGLKHAPRSAYLKEMETALLEVLRPAGKTGT